MRVGVVGATGKMGRVVCAAVVDDAGLTLAAGVARRGGARLGELIGRPGVDVIVSDRLDALADAKVDVAVDFTRPEAVVRNVHWYAEHHIHGVIGTTGITTDDIERIRELADRNRTNFVVASDFSLGGAVMAEILKIAARYFPEVELLDTHPPTKVDAPSGTTMNMARSIANVRRAEDASSSREVVLGARGAQVAGIHLHSLRLSGAPGEEEVRFARPGEQLTIRLIAFDREPYAVGTLIAIKAVASRPGLTYGFGELLRPTGG
jgi:4-hydroxy-tetrahydrodipicolinate reductase